MINNKKWSLKEIILLTIIAIISGVIFMGTDYLYNGLQLVLTPLGLQPLANDSIFGLWIIAGPLSGVIIRKKGAALLGEVLGAIIEMILGSEFGVMAVISGIIQGIGSEGGFLVTKYRNYSSILALNIGTVFTTIITFCWDLFKSGYLNYSLKLLIILFCVRLISVWLFSVPFTILINKLLNRATAQK